jgi:hypothetical protein
MRKTAKNLLYSEAVNCRMTPSMFVELNEVLKTRFVVRVMDALCQLEKNKSSERNFKVNLKNFFWLVELRSQVLFR